MTNKIICPFCTGGTEITDELMANEFIKCLYCESDFKNPLYNQNESATKITLYSTKKYSTEYLTKFFVLMAIVVAVIAYFNYDSYREDKKRNYPDKKGFYPIHKMESPSHAGSTNNPGIKILKRSIQYDSYTNSYTINCQIANNTGALITYIEVQAIFYDKNGNMLGTGIGNATNLADGYAKVISIIGIDIDSPNTYEIEINNVLYYGNIDEQKEMIKNFKRIEKKDLFKHTS